MLCTPRELRRLYDDVAPRYDSRIRWMDYIVGLSAMRRELFRRARGRVLDIATGTGANYEFFPSSCSITGIDLSERMLDVARERARTLGREVHLQQLDAQHIDYPSESFDTVVSALSLCTIPDPIRALLEMSRVCRKNGKILLLEHGPSDWKIIEAAQRILIGERHVRTFGCHWNREPLQLVEKAGLLVHVHRRRFFGVLHAIEASKVPIAMT